MSTTEVKNDTWENRISQTANILGKTSVEVETILNTPPYSINKDNGLELLSSEEATPFGDLRSLFCEKNNIPLPKLRMAIKYLRGKPGKVTTQNETDSALIELQTKYGIDTSLEDLDAEQLLPYYNPKRKNAIHDILLNRFGVKYGAFILFRPDTEDVAVEETLNYLADLESGYPAEETIEVDGEPVKPYEIGRIPDEMVDEDPLSVNTALKRDRSMVNRINWKDIPKEIRQFFRILHNRGDVSVRTVAERINVSTLIKMSLNELKELFPEAYVDFKTQKKNQTLPPLIVSVQEAVNRKSNPFGIGKNRSY